MNDIATARIEKIDRVELGLEGDLTLHQTEVYTDRDGMRRLLYRARRMVLTVDGVPGKDKNLGLRKVDLYQPEIFIRRERDGLWNVEWAFRSSKPPPPALQKSEAPPPGPPREAFPPEGVNIYGGTIHITVVGKSGREVTWTLTAARGVLSKEKGVISLRPFEGQFYGGRMVVDVDVPSTQPFSCNFQVKLTGADVGRLAERLALKKPVSGTMDAVLALTRSPRRTNSRPIAAGRMQVKDGDLWELPVFLNILSFIALDPGLKRSIDQAEVVFQVLEDRIRIEKMGFYGDPLCLVGDGEMDLTGENLNVSFIPRIGRHALGDMVPVLGDLVQWILDRAKAVALPVVLSGSFDNPKLSLGSER